MARRRMTSGQVESIAELLRENGGYGPCQWTLVGPREADGALLVLYRDKDIREGWLIMRGGLTVRPDPAETDPAAFYK